MKQRIGWIQGNENWAFRNICTHYKRALPDFEHADLALSDDVPSDAYFAVSPHMLHRIAQQKKTVLHLDSVRALYE